MIVIRPMPRVSALVAICAVAVLACAAPAASPPARPATATPQPPSSLAASPSAATATNVPSQAPSAAPPTEPPGTPTGPITGSLDILEWDGYQDPIYWADFQANYPEVTPNFTFGISDADIYSKMLLGDPSDIFHAYTGWLHFYVEDGLVAEIDTSKLTNWDKVPETYKAPGNFNGKQYFVPWDWGFSSILYRTDKVEAVDSWNILFDETYDNRISMWDDGPGAVSVSSYIHGWDETQITPDQFEQAKQEWIAQAPLNRLYWSAEYTDLVPAFQNNEVWIAYAWQGSYATLLGEGMPVAYADPVEGRNSYIGMYGINVNSPNYDLALRYLDAQLGMTTGTNLVTNGYYGHANSEVMASITDETLIQAFSLDDPTILETTNFTPNLTQEQRDQWTAMWSEVKAAQ